MVEPEEMGADITYEHMLTPNEVPSEIQKFYTDTNIFITGGTGFLGNLLIQKLIRSCAGLTKLYILMRSKMGISPEDRLDDMFKDPVFERMIIEQPDFYDKIQLIIGDCEKTDLGLTDESKKLLSEKINIVFHFAATRFEENIRRSTRINVTATEDLIKLSNTMQNLKAFVYVSSVFSHCSQIEIDEQFYDSPISIEKLFEITNTLNDEQLMTLTPQLLGKCPNTYCFTKSVAENLLKQKGKGLPIAIIRPSMVVSTCKEPLSGWTNNYYGPVGMVIAASLGLMRSFQAIPNNKADLVPADYVVNCVIVAAWRVGKVFYNDSNNELVNQITFDELKVQNNIPIFNYVCTPENSITWSEFMSLVKINGFRFPALLVVWYTCFTLNPNYYIHKIYTIFLHHIPAYIIDTVLFCVGKKPVMIEAYKKLHYFQNYFSYFTMKQWILKNNNTQALWKKLNATDRRLFAFSMRDFYWNEFCFTFIRGARVYLLKESMDTLPQAKRRYKIMKMAHYIIITIFCIFLLNVIRIFL